MRGYKTQNDNTSFDHNVNMDQNCNQSGQSNHADVNPKPSNLKMIFIATIVITVGVGFGIFIGYVLFGGDDDNGGNVNNDGNKESTEENMTATTGSENGHDWVDLGLPSGIKWATTNVGANAPEEYGDYFAWGETSAKLTYYDWSTYKWCRGSHDTPIKYIIDSYCGTIDNKTTLDPSDDAAHLNWGGKWRMPTMEEQKELLDFCDWTQTTINGVNGYLGKSKNNKNSIFLPAAGRRIGSDLEDDGLDGFFRSSTIAPSSYSDEAYSITFYGGGGPGIMEDDRASGASIRAVCL